MNEDNIKGKSNDNNDPAEDIRKVFSFLSGQYINTVKKFFGFLDTSFKKSLFILIVVFLISLIVLNLFHFNFFPTFLAYVFVAFIILLVVRSVKAISSSSRQKTSSNDKTYKKYQTEPTIEKPPSEDDLKVLYRKLIKKYHPDFAQNEADKKFRTELTAKITKAYENKDIKTLKLFE